MRRVGDPVRAASSPQPSPRARGGGEGKPLEPPVLTLSGITKRFGALAANENVSLSLSAGEVLALLGENGAGKTTLMNILFGHYVPDEGRVVAFGRELPPGSPRAAIDGRDRHGPPAFHARGEPERPRQRHDRHRTAVTRLASRREGRRKALGHRRAVRPCGRTRRPCRHPRRRRAPAGRDPEVALPRRARPHSRRANRCADAAGVRRPSSRRCAVVASKASPIILISHKLERGARASATASSSFARRAGRASAIRRTSTRPNSPS